jgi:penicillin amidase
MSKPGAIVEMLRDEWGIPHIKARGRQDAFTALGYAHAEDRLWQMEALLRRGTGRYAEWLGQAAVGGDVVARRLDTAGASQRDYAALNSETRAMLEAYAAGVNAFIGIGHRPVEYGILNAEPDAWQPWHSIAVMRQIGFLMGSVWWKLWRAVALPIVGVANVAKLRFDDGGNELLCLPPGVETGAFTAELRELKPGIEALLGTAAPDVSDGGSNNWILAPDRTETGRPLLAGDPHRVLEMPNMYAQVHLACDEFDVIGLTVPGVPGFPHFGHSESVAWSVTHAFVDIHDLYVECFGDGGATVLFRDTWEPVRRRRETIGVRGGADVAVEVVETRHGPVIAGDPASGSALALRSMQFAETDLSFNCMIPMMRAENVAALYEATRDWGMMDHNLVAGDVAGNVGYRVRAKVPRRPRSNGWLPVPGWTGAHEWDGMVPWESMPSAINPPGGVIVTANNRVTRDDDDEYLSTDAMPPHRARRIWRRLEMLAKANVDDMAAIHRDVETIPGQELRDRLRGLAGIESVAIALHRLIMEWDGRMDRDSEGASAYIAVRLALTRLVALRSGLCAAGDAPYAQAAPGVIPENQLWWIVPSLLRADDTSLLSGASWDDVLRMALRDAANTKLETWGRLHLPRFKHALSAAFPKQAAALDRFSAEVGGDNDTVFATGCVASVGTRAVSGSLCRYVFDVGAWDNCRWIVFHGASGDPDSSWYLNQNARWATGDMVPMLYDWNQVAAGATAQRRRRFSDGRVYPDE